MGKGKVQHIKIGDITAHGGGENMYHQIPGIPAAAGLVYVVTVDDLQLTGFSVNDSVGKLAGYLSLDEINQFRSPVPVGWGVGSGMDFMDDAKAGFIQFYNSFLFLESQKTHLKF